MSGMNYDDPDYAAVPDPVPARRPEDDALDRLEAIKYELTKPVQSQFIKSDCEWLVEQVERQREERDMARASRDDWERQAKGRGVVQYELLARAESAEAEVRQLREERDGLQGDVKFQYERRKGAEAEVRRLTEGLREFAEDQFASGSLLRRKARALLDASPTDGGGA